MRRPMRESKYVDIYREKHVRVSVKVLIPVREHPKVSTASYSNLNRFEINLSYVISCLSLISLGNCWGQKVIL